MHLLHAGTYISVFSLSDVYYFAGGHGLSAWKLAAGTAFKTTQILKISGFGSILPSRLALSVSPVLLLTTDQENATQGR